ncbi:hypothetical protein Taro_011182 [Colocasia esculenta]|uniref:Nudix hydrolase domain-containing protein n=1 Tax=Colocasia esculenta TaxID=4460 RepID=A0A843U980_COLES|nr:hypothetical protein [Colocasia esculenta]
MARGLPPLPLRLLAQRSHLSTGKGAASSALRTCLPSFRKKKRTLVATGVIMSMAALMKSQIVGSYNSSSLLELRIKKASALGFSRKERGSGFTIPKGRPTHLPFHNPGLSIDSNKPRTKAVASVVSPNTSFNITPELLHSYEDEYDGAIIDAECLPSSANAFSASLQTSLDVWKKKGKRGIWLKLLQKQADLVPVAIQEGFTYHHAEPGYIMLTYWIPEGPCMLPATATHQIGIGAFVMNESREVLVVKEKCCPRRCSGVWKLPTGLVNQAEEISEGATREVKEETGIDTMFLEVVAFRHAHLVTFEKSDLFFLCMLRPLTFDIKIDETEVQDAKWMPFDEFIGQQFYQEDCMSRKAIEICLARHENQYKGFTAHQVISKFDDRLSYLYYQELVKPTNGFSSN